MPKSEFKWHVVLMTARQSCRAGHQLVFSRLRDLDTLVEDVKRQNEQQSSRQFAQLERITDYLESNEQSSDEVRELAKSNYTILQSIPALIQQAVASRYFQESNSSSLHSLDPTHGKPVWFEDSLGNVLELPLDWITTWEVRNQTAYR